MYVIYKDFSMLTGQTSLPPNQPTGLKVENLGGSGGREVRAYDSRFDHLQSLSSVLGSNPGTFSDSRRKSSARE